MGVLSCMYHIGSWEGYRKGALFVRRYDCLETNRALCLLGPVPTTDRHHGLWLDPPSEQQLAPTSRVRPFQAYTGRWLQITEYP
jgi:hypothetical protein